MAIDVDVERVPGDGTINMRVRRGHGCTTPGEDWNIPFFVSPVKIQENVEWPSLGESLRRDDWKEAGWRPRTQRAKRRLN